MKNGDAIRSMTDEELAQFILTQFVLQKPYCRYACSDSTFDDWTCNDCVLEWLVEEAKA